MKTRIFALKDLGPFLGHYLIGECDDEYSAASVKYQILHKPIHVFEIFNGQNSFLMYQADRMFFEHSLDLLDQDFYKGRTLEDEHDKDVLKLYRDTVEAETQKLQARRSGIELQPKPTLLRE